MQALPDDLKTKLSIDDDVVLSPKEALSRASADRRTKYLNRYVLIILETDDMPSAFFHDKNCF